MKVRCYQCSNLVTVMLPPPGYVICDSCYNKEIRIIPKEEKVEISHLEINELNWLREVVKVANNRLSKGLWQNILDEAAMNWVPHMFGGDLNESGNNCPSGG